ncbi:alpha/beta hydrolase [Polyangium jinanense]|uniref:alpha/beta fold hydrolase n=1 Tax=Polyangium jinanense TaxID=2829994 RepID=UPI00234137CE|nr:alpha/beta hydrolase [Polyangium jinanense]MDC3955293.1 alpha/beta hydrolase [Polyangium jinanense]
MSRRLPAIHYETYGQGIPLLLGFPIMASAWQGDPERAILKGYLDRLTGRYRVLVVDYPSLGPDIGKSEPIPAKELSAERVCSDLLVVADEVGFDRFVFWGYSWGGVVGLQLASRTDRVSTLVCGGWPPLGAPYAEMLAITRMMAAAPDVPVRVEQFVTFYESIQGWPEAEAVARISCPRMAFVGAADEMNYPGGIALRLAQTVKERRPELERLGWHVLEVPGRDHGLYTDPATVVPLVREFLDPVCG